MCSGNPLRISLCLTFLYRKSPRKYTNWIRFSSVNKNPWIELTISLTIPANFFSEVRFRSGIREDRTPHDQPLQLPQGSQNPLFRFLESAPAAHNLPGPHGCPVSRRWTQPGPLLL